MLSNVHVKNFALIDEADIELAGNLNILTGETGAGKSILLGAINLALGARTSKDSVRANADYALAELTFTELNDKVLSVCEELGIDTDGDELVISRKLMQNGKSIIRINGETMNAAAARMLTCELIDIYGQNEHQSLLDAGAQLEIVDRFLGPEAVSLKSDISVEYEEYASLKKELGSLENNPLKRAREIDRIQSEILEIEQAELKEGEEEELKAERKVLANSELINEALGNACGYLYEDNACSDLISAAIKALSKVAELDENLGGYLEELNEIDSRISDVYRELEDYLDSIPQSKERLHEVEDRLDLIAGLKMKFGNSVEEIYDFLEENKIRLKKLTEFESYVFELEDKITVSERKCREHSEELSRLRLEAAEILKRQISNALLELNFNRVSFDISFTRKDELHADGIDNTQFLISMNPGEELKPLARVASGGEMSRIMLAVKSVFAKRETIGTLIFDEIDAGISGITAQKVADKLCAISSGHQVICITHLPQIAAMADAHFKVEKRVEGDKTLVDIRLLDSEGTLGEIARILGGEDSSQSVMDAASDIRKNTELRKATIRR